METPLAARDQWIELAKTDRLRGLLKRVAPRIVRIYTLRGFESVLAGSVQVSTGTKTSLSFQDGPVFTRVHRREGPAAPRSLLPSDPRARPRLQDRVHPRLPEPAGASHADPTRAPQGRTATRPRPVRPLRLGRPKGRPQAPFQPSHENRYPFTNWSTFAPPKWSKFTPPLTAVRTDDDLNELGRFNIRCRLLPHIVPSPGALRVTSVTPAMLTNPTLPSHYEAIRQIRAKLLEWSPATFIGFNSLKFDEPLLRQALFQTLHPAYLTNTNDNARSDVMRVAHAVSIYASDSIVVPTDDQGQQTFRLERLAPTNGYNHDEAHEAMADVEATIYIARLARDRAPHIWQAMDRASTKMPSRHMSRPSRCSR